MAAGVALRLLLPAAVGDARHLPAVTGDAVLRLLPAAGVARLRVLPAVGVGTTPTIRLGAAAAPVAVAGDARRLLAVGVPAVAAPVRPAAP
jgi:hypothetical protein